MDRFVAVGGGKAGGEKRGKGNFWGRTTRGIMHHQSPPYVWWWFVVRSTSWCFSAVVLLVEATEVPPYFPWLGICCERRLNYYIICCRGGYWRFLVSPRRGFLCFGRRRRRRRRRSFHLRTADNNGDYDDVVVKWRCCARIFY